MVNVELELELDLKVELIRGFANKNRLQILACIMNEEKTVSQIVNELNGSQSNISQHLACLKGCGLITSRQEGKYVHYQIRNNQVRELLKMFDVVLADVQEDISTCENHII